MSRPLRSRTIAPMKARAGELPTSGDWVYEIKWDGMRIVAFIDEGGVRLQSANLRNVSVSFPELNGLGEVLEDFDAVVLDGEVVAFDENGHPSFGALQDRMHVTAPAEAARRAAANPVSFVVFDLLHLNGNDTMELPLSARRRLLEQVLEPGEHWRPTDVHTDDAAALLDVVTDAGLEGLIAKQAESRYLEGGRSSTWRKIKSRHRQEFVVGGWAEGREGRAGSIGSLLIGYYDGAELYSAGSVGSGLDGAALRDWTNRLTPIAREKSPFVGEPIATMGRTFRWVEPEYVIEVEFGEWTSDGNLRHPSYVGLRSDKDPGEVTRHP
ncbi:MAG: non-homologous end-joining DNA ligase [Acidimicrobiales bacterium]